jgi:hypothetical protein
MPALEIPRGPHDLTPEWLTRALRSTGAIQKAAVTSFDLKPNIAAGTGFMGVLSHLSLQYDQPEEGALRTLVAKLPTPAAENRAVAERYRFYEIETSFYREIAPHVDLRTPRVYYNAYDPGTGDFVLLLEDLAPACCGDQVGGCTIEQAELSLRELAKFHAAWWNNPKLLDYSWLPETNETVRAETAQANYQQAWVPFVENFGKLVPPDALAVGEQFGSRVVQIMGQLSGKPYTIMHGDYRLDNLFFATPEGGDPLTVIDWQIISRGRGIFDVAYFMTGTLPVEERRAKEMDLLRLYHETLVAHGVTDYPLDQLMQDYRAAILFCWLYVVIVLGTLDVATERGLALFTANMDRGVAALQDHKAGELLPA